jgi:hypothetical protein
MITITVGQYVPRPAPDPELVQDLALSVRQNRPGHWHGISGIAATAVGSRPCLNLTRRNRLDDPACHE